MPRLNPELFPETLLELEPNESFYAYFDSYEDIVGEENMVLRFNCIQKSYADQNTLTDERINQIHSVIIELTGTKDYIKALFPNRRISSLESEWMLLYTKESRSEEQLDVYVNFDVYDGFPNNESVGLERIILFNELNRSEKQKIKEIIKATSIKESTQEDVESFLPLFDDVDPPSHVMVYNVGQGNFNAIVNRRNQPLLYFDVGGGCVAYKNTYPVGFSVCDCSNVPVVLSHWDMDHIISAFYHQRLLQSKWLVPKQHNLSIDAKRLANALQSKSNLTVWNNNLSVLDFQSISVIRCTGNFKNKNNSGLALLFKDLAEKSILLPGDASFNHIPGLQGFLISGLVASHHGSKTGYKQIPVCNTLGMIAYSYGKGNSYPHPHPDTIKEYTRKNWIYTLNSPNGNIALSNTISQTHSNCGGELGYTNPGCTMQVNQYF